MLLHSIAILALASLGASKNFGYLQPPRPVANSSDLYGRQAGCYSGAAAEIDCDGNCIPNYYDCCRLGDGSYCETLCEPLGGGCKDSKAGNYPGGDGGSGGGYGDDDSDSDGDGCQDGYTPCGILCIPPTGMCCDNGGWCKLGKCTSNGECDLSEYEHGEQSSGSAQTATEAGGSSSTGSSSSGKGSDNDEKESSSKEENNTGGDDKDSDKDSDEEASESKDGDKGNDASLRLPTLAVGLVALVPLLM